jgi:hypothetical protein
VIDTLARAAFEAYYTGFSVEKLGSPYGSGKPTTWDNMAPELKDHWRRVARAVLRAKDDLGKERKYSPTQILQGLVNPDKPKSSIISKTTPSVKLDPRLQSHTPSKR